MSDGHTWPRPRAAWGMVALLTVAYLVSYVDRAILGLLIQPIKADLSLSDEQIGLVLGPAFAIFYATIGVPLGWLVDRRSRTKLIAAGIALWSAATAFSGLVRGFPQLFAARMTVGVGEAVLSPAAFSMIGDSFPEEKRARPIAVYSMAITLGTGLASLIGAVVLTWAKQSGGVEVPFLGELAPWRLTFLAVGLPGLLLAAAFLVLRDPPRLSRAGVDANGFGDALRHVGSHAKEYALIVSIVAAMVIVAYSQGFLAAAFERRWGWPPEYYAQWNGLSALIVGPAVYLWAGSYCDRLAAAGDRNAPRRIMAWGIALLVPANALAMLMPGPWIAFAFLVIGSAAISAISAVGVTALLAITPGQIRGQVVAMYYMAISLAGLLLGPTTVGMLSTRVVGEDNLHLAVAAVPLIYATIPAILALVFFVWRKPA
ncbi:L-galactonate transporter [Tsuneonella dongtanensis]|uniref:L-galactonate transporter n=1 Tax=Tsuneonella dongtanensis TaxID=692370 RepID=A0A1B2AG45_9SPHN|nr:MFS transporter [Tsuneonella dongtanensis]ANY21078.1 L-galactonate transporter [Tsuneonella dongtanensis]